jgi:CP family cyanate transporter-like MFS transporter
LRRAGAPVALATLFLAAFALRPQLIGIGPLLPLIQDDLDVSHAVAGLLVTIVVVCMGVFAPPGPLLAARLGSRRALALCLGVVTVFGTLRALAPGAPAVLLLTLPVGIALGLSGPLMAVVVKERFSSRPAFATGIYATGLVFGSACASFTAVPIAHAFDGWRSSLLVFSAASAIVLVVWLAVVKRPAPRERVAVPRLPRMPFRSPVAWALGLAFAAEGFTFYGITTWLADAYTERGWSEAGAGALVGVVLAVGLPTGLLVPYLADRAGSRRLYLSSSAGLLCVSTLGFVAFEQGAAVWVCATAAGAALGALFPLILTLPLDVADEAHDVGAAAGMMLAVGYTFSATAPFVLGAARDATGSFAASLWLLVAFAAASFATTLPLSHARLHRGIRRVPAPPVAG